MSVCPFPQNGQFWGDWINSVWCLQSHPTAEPPETFDTATWPRACHQLFAFLWTSKAVSNHTFPSHAPQHPWFVFVIFSFPYNVDGCIFLEKHSHATRVGQLWKDLGWIANIGRWVWGSQIISDSFSCPLPLLLSLSCSPSLALPLLLSTFCSPSLSLYQSLSFSRVFLFLSLYPSLALSLSLFFFFFSLSLSLSCGFSFQCAMQKSLQLLHLPSLRQVS